MAREIKSKKEMAKFIALCLMNKMNILLILLPIIVFNFLQKNNPKQYCNYIFHLTKLRIISVQIMKLFETFQNPINSI